MTPSGLVKNSSDKAYYLIAAKPLPESILICQLDAYELAIVRYE